jgi:hypothetical protein
MRIFSFFADDLIGTEPTRQRPSVMFAHQGKADIEATIRQVRE